MTIEAFAREVKEMQRLQKEYFARRNPGVLEQSKAQERKVAKMVDEILNPSLFGGE